ncbi:hypothetical protein V5P93_004263 [Actinokineospora auranticolor]|uniref:NPCBM/NEW2 domain-containing protein n=1 Tax=Actinokineospora auranticolor TaxID=155976 RepID=A0A2S6GID6_9PSEU|nr:hypothetical protein [Actinokineospora auranticolor]PPK64992.1 hypothetical protein CLV40_11634 [Actinokineospora auranticolor]
MTGDNQARWRVTAVGADGTPGPSSPWGSFRFTTGPYNMYDNGVSADWATGAGTIPYGADADARGFAIPRDGVYDGDCALEDGSAPRYVETHPEMKPGGWIEGTYTLPGPVSPGQRFRTSLGYIQCGSNPTAGIDDFVVLAVMPNGTRREVVRSNQTGTDHAVHGLEVDLTPFQGATKLVLRVEDDKPNGQDWACWVEPRVER